LNYQTLLRYIWLLSFEKKTDEVFSELKILLETLVIQTEKKDRIAYNFKNANQICQIFMNFYPEITKKFFEGERELNTLKQLISDPFCKKISVFLEFMIELTDQALKINKYNTDRNKENSMLMTFIAQKKAPNFLIYKSQKMVSSNVFEESVYEILKLLEGYSLQRNIKIGIYEVSKQILDKIIYYLKS
jgi:hypothetical protein